MPRKLAAPWGLFEAISKHPDKIAISIDAVRLARLDEGVQVGADLRHVVEKVALRERRAGVAACDVGGGLANDA